MLLLKNVHHATPEVIYALTEACVWGLILFYKFYLKFTFVWMMHWSEINSNFVLPVTMTKKTFWFWLCELLCFLSVCQNHPSHELNVPRGLQEADFLALLRSTFPQLAAGEPFTILIGRNHNLIPPRVESMTAEEICKNGTGNPGIYIRLKVLQEPI